MNNEKIHTVEIGGVYRWTKNKKHDSYSLLKEIFDYLEKDTNHILRLPFKKTNFEYSIIGGKARFECEETIKPSEIILRISRCITTADKIHFIITYDSMNVDSVSFGVYVETNDEIIKVNPEDISEDKSYASVFASMLVVLLSIIFINFNNTEICEEHAALKKRKWNSLNRGRKEIIYHNIFIYLKKKKYLIDSILEQDSDTSSPLTTVRSHKKFYSKEKPLFGKYSGWVWVPSYFRGSEDNGIIEKDYTLVAF